MAVSKGNCVTKVRLSILLILLMLVLAVLVLLVVPSLLLLLLLLLMLMLMLLVVPLALLIELIQVVLIRFSEGRGPPRGIPHQYFLTLPGFKLFRAPHPALKSN